MNITSCETLEVSSSSELSLELLLDSLLLDCALEVLLLEDEDEEPVPSEVARLFPFCTSGRSKSLSLSIISGSTWSDCLLSSSCGRGLGALIFR